MKITDKTICEVQRKIDLEDYFNSVSFFGYFSGNSNSSKQQVFLAIEYLFGFLCNCELSGDKIFVLSNLYIDKNVRNLKKLYGMTDAHIAEYFLPLLKTGVVKNSGDLEDLPKEFHFSGELPKDEIRKVCFITMMLGGLFGNFFIVVNNTESMMAIYPHDEVGFGVLSLGNTIDLEKKFIDEVNDKHFDKILKGQMK